MTARSARRTAALAFVAWAVLITVLYYDRFAPLLAGDLRALGSPIDGPRNHQLPYLSEALVVALGATAAMVVLLAAALAVGALAGRALGNLGDTPRERFCIHLGLGIGVLGTLGLALAAVGLYRPVALRLLVAVSVLLGALTMVRRRRRSSEPWSGWRFARPGAADRVWIAVVLLAIAVAFAIALAPEDSYDPLWYHLNFPRLYLQVGRLVDLPYEYVSLYPLTWSLWYGYGLAFGGLATAKLLHFAMLPAIALLLYEMTRRVAPRANAWAAVAIFVTIPTIIWEGGTAHNDLAFAFFALLAVHSAMRLAETDRRSWLVLTAIAAGLALSIKHIGLVWLAVLAPALLLLRWRTTGRLKRAVEDAALLGIVALVIPLPWYVRSWLATGNPVFPELFGIFGAPPQRWDARTDAGLQGFFDRFGRPRTLGNQLTLPWDVTMHAARYGGALGPLLLILLPGLLVRRTSDEARQRPRLLWWMGAIAAGYFAIWASPIASFQLRWLLPITPLLALLAAEGHARVAASLDHRAGSKALALLIAGLCVLNLPPFTGLHQRDREGWTGWINSVQHGIPVVSIGAESREAYLRRKIPTYGAWRSVRADDHERRTLAFSGGDHYFAIGERLGVLTPYTRDVAWAVPSDSTAAIAGLRRLGITHVLFEKEFLPRNGFGDSARWDDWALTGERFRTAHYERLYEDEQSVLYRVRWETLPIPPANATER